MAINSHGHIEEKLKKWLYNELNCPPYDKSNPEIWRDFRRKHDDDARLSGGNLNADEIISLWTPLKITTLYIAGGDQIFQQFGIPCARSGGAKMYKILLENMDLFFPPEKEEIALLNELFEYGQERCNVMILPFHYLHYKEPRNGWQADNKGSVNQVRGMAPYFDYIPPFLYDCFSGGWFAECFDDDEELLRWLEEQKLHPFFDGEFSRESIKDLAGLGSITGTSPNWENVKDVESMLRTYIDVLSARKELLNQ